MMRKLSLLILMMLLPMLASADAVEINGIYYNLYAEDNTAEVVEGKAKYTGDYYKGDVVIPESIEFEGKTYCVTKIGSTAFWFSSVTSVIIPNTVTAIGSSAFKGCI